jgi:hypothetical protein
MRDSDAQRSSVWRSVAKASAESPYFAERQILVLYKFFQMRNTLKMLF